MTTSTKGVQSSPVIHSQPKIEYYEDEPVTLIILLVTFLRELLRGMYPYGLDNYGCSSC